MGNRLGLDPEHFKHVKSTEDETILEHKHGHVLRIKHDVLPPKERAQLIAMAGAEKKPHPYGKVVMTDDKSAKTPAQAGESRQERKEQPGVAPKKLAEGTPEGPLRDEDVMPDVESRTDQPETPEAVAAAATPLGINTTDEAAAEPPLRDSDEWETSAGTMPPEGPAPERSPAQAAQPGQPTQPVEPPAATSFQEHKAQALRDAAQEAQAFDHDLYMGHIQPKTYESLFHDKSTLGKIGTLFGMLVGGFGAGMSGQKNALLEMMNQTIDRDLDAQKTSAANAQNFLRLSQQGELNKAQVANLNAETNTKAFALARIRMNQAALHKLTQDVQKLPVGSPQRMAAEQNLAMLNQAVQNDNYNLADRAATASAYYKMVLGGSEQQESPAVAIRKKQLVGAITPQQSEQALREVKEIENHNQVNKNALNSFDQIAKMQTLANRTANPIQAGKRIDANWNAVAEQITKDTEGRVTPITMDVMKSLRPEFSDDAKTIKLKREKFDALLHHGYSTPTLDSIGVSIPKVTRQSNDMEGKTAVNAQGQRIIMQNGRWVPLGR